MLWLFGTGQVPPAGAAKCCTDDSGVLVVAASDHVTMQMWGEMRSAGHTPRTIPACIPSIHASTTVFHLFNPFAMHLTAS